MRCCSDPAPITSFSIGNGCAAHGRVSLCNRQRILVLQAGPQLSQHDGVFPVPQPWTLAVVGVQQYHGLCLFWRFASHSARLSQSCRCNDYLQSMCYVSCKFAALCGVVRWHSLCRCATMLYRDEPVEMCAIPFRGDVYFECTRQSAGKHVSSVNMVRREWGRRATSRRPTALHADGSRMRCCAATPETQGGTATMPRLPCLLLPALPQPAVICTPPSMHAR